MAISKRLRYEIFRRDNHTCRYCGAAAPDVHIELDHIVPKILGGTDKADNLVTACNPCNNGKGASSPDAPLIDDVAQDAVRWAAAMKRAAEQQRAEQQRSKHYRQSVIRVFTEAFCGKVSLDHEPGWSYKSEPQRTYEWVVNLDGRRGVHLADTAEEACEWINERIGHLRPPMPSDWDASVHVWEAAGIDQDELAHAAKIAADATYVGWSDRYRYFCGIVWKKIEERQEIARQLIEADGDGSA